MGGSRSVTIQGFNDTLGIDGVKNIDTSTWGGQDKDGNGEFDKWYEKENKRRKDLSAYTFAMMAIALAQMVFYYIQFKKRLSKRDEEIDSIVDFMQYLQDRKHSVDIPMLDEKAKALDEITVPTVSFCGDPTELRECSVNDGEAIDNLSMQLSRTFSSGLPNTWGIHEGALMQARSVSNAGGLLVNASIREQERVRKAKTRLVAQAQQNTKSSISASSILQRYAQAMTIHSGLADIYISGFNSAGASFGTYLGQISNGTMNTSGTTNSGNTIRVGGDSSYGYV